MARNLLIVEGPGDRHFVNHLLMSRGFTAAAGANAKNFLVNKPSRPGAAAIKIIVAGSFNSLGKAIEDEFRPDETTGLAIVADMDLLADNRWESLRGTLEKFGFDSLPGVPSKDGLVARQEQNPALGVWMMPNNESAGMLASFACKLVAGEDPAWVHARKTVATLPEEAGRFSRERHLEKA